MGNSFVISSFFASYVLTLSLNRPEKRNALSHELLQQFLNALHSIPKEVRVLILQGEGKVFCAGMDLEEAKEEGKRKEMNFLFSEILKTMLELPFVVVAYVEGGAYAGGIGLLAASDLAIATRESFFSLPELRRGVLPALVHLLLQSQIPSKFLNELALIGEPITAVRAQTIGLINRVISREEKGEILRDLVKHLLKDAPQTVAIYKKNLFQRGDLPHLFSHALELHEKARITGEAEEGMRAFLEKRAPPWAF